MKDTQQQLRKPWEKFSYFDGINYVFLAVLTFIMLFPFYNSVILAFNDGKDAISGNIFFWPRVFTLSNFSKVFQDDTVINAFFVSAARSVLTTILNLLVTSLFAYAISKSHLRFRRTYLVIMFISMYFSGGLIPSFLLIKSLGLYNNFFVYVLPGAFSVFNAFIFMSFFRGIPAALEESARIDGATTTRIFFRIIVPLSKPVFASITLFTAVGQWNAWYDNLLYVKNESLTTLSFMFIKMIKAQEYLMKVQESNLDPTGMSMTVTTTSLQLATMVVSVIPIMLIYPFLQKYFAKGVMIGSVKG